VLSKGFAIKVNILKIFIKSSFLLHLILFL